MNDIKIEELESLETVKGGRSLANREVVDEVDE